MNFTNSILNKIISILPPEETWGSNGATYEDQSVDESLYHDQLKVLGYNAYRNKVLSILSAMREELEEEKKCSNYPNCNCIIPGVEE